MSTLCAELLGMTRNIGSDYSLGKIDCICGGIASPTRTDITYNFEGKTIVVKNVPVLRCGKCEELYNDPLIDLRVEELAFRALKENISSIHY